MMKSAPVNNMAFTWLFSMKSRRDYAVNFMSGDRHKSIACALGAKPPDFIMWWASFSVCLPSKHCAITSRP
jgi:hypothetical protein